MTDLVAELRWLIGQTLGHRTGDALRRAADALEAKDREIARLKLMLWGDDRSEIERLTADLDLARVDVAQFDTLKAERDEARQAAWRHTIEITDLRAERDRLQTTVSELETVTAGLRAALEDILAYADDPEARANRGLSIAQYAVGIAREALAGEPHVHKWVNMRNDGNSWWWSCDCGEKRQLPPPMKPE